MIEVSDIPEGYRRCTGPCGRVLPATEEFFYVHLRPNRKTREMVARCKTCHNKFRKRKKKTSFNSDVPTEAQSVTISELAKCIEQTHGKVKQDIYSGKLRATQSPDGMFHISLEDAKEYIARVTLNGHSQTDIPIEQESELCTAHQCGSCGTTKGNILGDVNKATGEKYGLLCMKCYQLVRDFGTDIPRIRKILAYLELTRSSVYTKK